MTKTLTIQDAPTLEETLERMRAKLSGIVPDVEIGIKASLAYEINHLKSARNAVILGHNYMEPALYHSVPDYVGDSLELARVSAETDADIIVFCGVQFMAETAKILNPDKTVLIPSEKAGCSLASGISAADVRDLKERHPGVPVVSYINTYAEVKVESDYCCTSGNAAAVVQHLFDEGRRQVIFVPDEYLARNTAQELGAGFALATPNGTDDLGTARIVIGWTARCEVHEKFTVRDVHDVRKQFPDVAVLAHPECSPEVIRECDYTGSTKQMANYVQNVEAAQYFLLTECSMADNIAASSPGKEMIRLCSLRCPHMNQITLEDTVASLKEVRYEVDLTPEVIERARLPIDRMLSIG